MWVKKSLYGINCGLVWRGKVLAHVVEEYLVFVRGLGFESYVCQIMCCCFIVIFNNMYEYGIDDVNYFALEGITKCELA